MLTFLQCTLHRRKCNCWLDLYLCEWVLIKAYPIKILADIKFGNFSPATVFFNLANFKLYRSVPWPRLPIFLAIRYSWLWWLEQHRSTLWCYTARCSILLITARLLVKLTTEFVDVVVTPITLHIDEIDVGNWKWFLAPPPPPLPPHPHLAGECGWDASSHVAGGKQSGPGGDQWERGLHRKWRIIRQGTLVERFISMHTGFEELV